MTHVLGNMFLFQNFSLDLGVAPVELYLALLFISILCTYDYMYIFKERTFNLNILNSKRWNAFAVMGVLMFGVFSRNEFIYFQF